MIFLGGYRNDKGLKGAILIAIANMKQKLSELMPDDMFALYANISHKAAIRKCYLIEKDDLLLLSPKANQIHPADFTARFEPFFKIEPTDTVVDVGACIGDTTINMAKRAKRGIIIGIEPHPENVMFLAMNLASYKNTIIIPKAAYGTKGQMQLKLHTAITGHSLEDAPGCTHGDITVETDTLNNMLAPYKVDFLKIDVQGSELEVLKGADKD
jgi:FkbM family methyltransferase